MSFSEHLFEEILRSHMQAAANQIEIAAEALRFKGPPAHANFISKASAADRLDRIVRDMRNALAQTVRDVQPKLTNYPEDIHA